MVIDKDGVIVIGHCRYEAAKRLGLKVVPVVMADELNDEQVRKLRLLDNKTNESPWDFDLLTEDLEGLDFDEFEVDWGINIDVKEQPIEDEYKVELPEKAKAKSGNVYQLGRHRLMCGDSLRTENVEKLLNGQRCELTFTDPPYRLNTNGGGILKNANSMRQIKNNGVDAFDPQQIVLYSDTNIYFHNKALIKDYIELAERYNQPYDLCFYKKLCTVPNYAGHLMTDCEYIAIIGKQNPNKGLEKDLYSKCFVGKKDNDNCLSYSKPIELCAKYIQLFSQSKILDLFGGSGSTLIACEQLNRTCFMMELDPKYVDVIIDRWEQFTGQKAVILEEGD